MIELLLDGCVRMTMLGLMDDKIIAGWVCESDDARTPG